jgi:hypothetical protein
MENVSKPKEGAFPGESFHGLIGQGNLSIESFGGTSTYFTLVSIVWAEKI